MFHPGSSPITIPGPFDGRHYCSSSELPFPRSDAARGGIRCESGVAAVGLLMQLVEYWWSSHATDQSLVRGRVIGCDGIVRSALD
jgi:hypothetical protein